MRHDRETISPFIPVVETPVAMFIRNPLAPAPTSRCTEVVDPLTTRGRHGGVRPLENRRHRNSRPRAELDPKLLGRRFRPQET
jgi:hypothetical protein